MRYVLLAGVVLALGSACNGEVGARDVDAADLPGLDASIPADADEPEPDVGRKPGRDASAPDAAKLPLDAAIPPDASAPDAALPETIKVTCTAPADPFPANTRVDVTCQIDNAGRSIAAPLLSAAPSAGVVFVRGVSDTQLSFSLATGSPGYLHPVDYADTTYQLTVEAHDSLDPTRWGKGTAQVTVLGNYWVGDHTNNDYSAGVLSFTSDGMAQAQAIGNAQIRGVYDLQLLPDGNVVVSSQGQLAIKVFTRQGTPVARTFPDVDPFTSQSLWQHQFEEPGPRQMAVVGDELWVTGARETDYGLAVFAWKTGAFLRFIPTPVATGNPFAFTSIVRRPDGTVLASSSARRTICAFDDKTHGPLGATPCFTIGDDFCEGWSSFAVLPSGEIAAALLGEVNQAGCPLAKIGTGLNLTLTKYMPVGIEVYGMVVSGKELVALTQSTRSVGDTYFLRADAVTLDSNQASWWPFTPPASTTVYNPSGLLRLTQL